MNALCIQYACTNQNVPNESEFKRWVDVVIAGELDGIDTFLLTIRLVDATESALLNQHYRHKIGPTNVLSFPAQMAKDDIPILGDILLCVPLIEQEALAQHKTLHDHLSHLTIHGVLHLLGYDHETEAEATTMEQLEISYLQSLGIPNPYRESEDYE